MAPATFFVMSNVMSSRIQIEQNNIVSFYVDPAVFMINQEVLSRLQKIEHLSET